MKKHEASDLLSMVTDMYPHHTYGKHALEMFYETLKDLPFDGAKAAMIGVMRRKKDFPPTAGGIRDEYYRMHGVGSGEDEWLRLVAMVRQGPPYKPDQFVNPVAVQSVAACGGVAALQQSEHLTLFRKDFLQAYTTLREIELIEPTSVQDMLGIEHGSSEGKLAGARTAIGPTTGASGGRQSRGEPSGTR